MNDMAVSLELAQLALRLEDLHARLLAANVARLGAGSETLFTAQMDAAYAQLRQAAASPATLSALQGADAGALEQMAGVTQTPVPVGASADALILDMTRASARYQALADGIGRQYNLMAIAIRGAR